MSDIVGVTVTGAAGRMGRALVQAVSEVPSLKLEGATEAPGHGLLGADAGEVAGIGALGVKISDDLASVARPGMVVIDFTAPAATMAHAAVCAEKGAAMVIGTTGLAEEQREKVAETCAGVPVVLAPNMSVGVNLLFWLVEQASKITGELFDIEIVEAHHRMKKDAPSGTALKLAEMAARGRGWSLSECGRYCREGMIGERPGREIGVQTVRAGDIVGDHTVTLAGPLERIELTHRAHDREVFAKGAARAAAWIADKKPALYDMQDVLGIK